MIDSFSRRLEKNALAIVLALLPLGIALTGYTGVWIARFLFFVTFVAICFAVRPQPARWRFASIGLAAFGLLTVAIVFQPAVTPADTGILRAGASTIFWSGNASEIKAVEIGTTGTKLVFTSPEGELLLPFLSRAQFKIERVDGKSKVSALVTDSTGKITAELRRNEWKVAPAPETWDRNYSDDALEVIDPQGKVVLQVRVLPDRVQRQGEWWGAPEGPRYKGVRVVQYPHPKDNYTSGFIFLPADATKPEIERMFEYPSERHLGELRR
jgi:hypothetical protein